MEDVEQARGCFHDVAIDAEIRIPRHCSEAHEELIRCGLHNIQP